jgi:hypothetical protein
MDASGFLADPFHENCNSFLCEIECISSLNMHLKLYLTELSRVFFKKANIRNKHPWWLSTFYSFCIQSIVRKALMRLTTASDRGATDGMHLPAKHYLYLPVRLFIASSAAYDIQNLYLEEKSKPGGEGIPSAEDYREARRAVGQTAWASNGISVALTISKSSLRTMELLCNLANFNGTRLEWKQSNCRLLYQVRHHLAKSYRLRLVLSTCPKGDHL